MKVKELLATPKQWTTHTMARNEAGKLVAQVAMRLYAGVYWGQFKNATQI